MKIENKVVAGSQAKRSREKVELKFWTCCEKARLPKASTTEGSMVAPGNLRLADQQGCLSEALVAVRQIADRRGWERFGQELKPVWVTTGHNLTQ